MAKKDCSEQATPEEMIVWALYDSETAPRPTGNSLHTCADFAGILAWALAGHPRPSPEVEREALEVLAGSQTR